MTSQDTKNNTSTKSWESKNYCLNTAMTYAFSLIRFRHIPFIKGLSNFFSNEEAWQVIQIQTEMLQLFFSIFVYNFYPISFPAYQHKTL